MHVCAQREFVAGKLGVRDRVGVLVKDGCRLLMKPRTRGLVMHQFSYSWVIGKLGEVTDILGMDAYND